MSGARSSARRSAPTAGAGGSPGACTAACPTGGDGEQPEVLYGGIPYGERASGALDDRGDAAVAWTNGDAFARSRPAGNVWGPTSTTFVRQGSLSSYQLAMDT